MKVSIITIVLNDAEYIEDCILSVINQSYKDVEYIIIDGNSTDDTVRIIKRYNSKIETLLSEPDRGIYDAMNKGLAMASGEIIGFLNADDLYSDVDVMETVAAAMRDPKIDACYSDLIYVGRHDSKKILRYWRSCPFEAGLFKKGWAPPHPTFFVRKKIYDRCGGFDLKYKLAADFELMARLLEFHKIRAVHIPKILVKMRLGGATNKSIVNIVKQNMEILQACRQNGIEISILAFLMSKFIARLKQFCAKPVV